MIHRFTPMQRYRPAFVAAHSAADLVAADAIGLLDGFVLAGLPQPGAQDGQRNFPVLVLRPLGLAADVQAGGSVPDLDGAADFVAMLAARTGTPAGGDVYVGHVERKLAGGRFFQDSHGDGAGVDFAGAISHPAVAAGFVLEDLLGRSAGDAQCGEAGTDFDRFQSETGFGTEARVQLGLLDDQLFGIITAFGGPNFNDEVHAVNYHTN
jgi:hypothetical protein